MSLSKAEKIKIENPFDFSLDTMSVTSFLKKQVIKNENVVLEDFQLLLSSFDKLISFDDELTALILDNNAIDIVYSNMKIVIENFEDQIHRSERPHQGSFGLANRTVNICTSIEKNYISTLIHELTHAVTGFAFRFDPFPCMAFYNNLLQMPKQVMEFVQDPVLPYPMRNNPFSKNKLNPAKLKFSYCAREDIKHFSLEYSTAITSTIGTSTELSEILWTLNNLHLENPESIPNQEELLPIYMQLRIELLDLIKKKSLSVELAYDVLSNILPRTHDYAETDLKKVLKYRIHRLYLEVHAHNIESQFYKQFYDHKNEEIKTGFQLDGTLKFHKYEPIRGRFTFFSNPRPLLSNSNDLIAFDNQFFKNQPI